MSPGGLQIGAISSFDWCPWAGNAWHYRHWAPQAVAGGGLMALWPSTADFEAQLEEFFHRSLPFGEPLDCRGRDAQSQESSRCLFPLRRPHDRTSAPSL
jgi:putative alpha-1,2-mannosidase